MESCMWAKVIESEGFVELSLFDLSLSSWYRQRPKSVKESKSFS